MELTLDELPLYRCNEFWGQQTKSISSFEKLKILSVTGGVPRYLEEIIPTVPAEKLIANLCFRKEGLLFNEFQRIFSDLFSTRSLTYLKIVRRLVQGTATPDEIYSALGVEKSGVVSGYLDDLCTSGFIQREFTWTLHGPRESKLSRYRLRDNYLRFYLKYVEPNRTAIELGRYAPDQSKFSSIMGLQFENLVLHNRQLIWKILGIDPGGIEFDNPFFQTKTAKRKGCQIDYLIQVNTGTLWGCEIKFSKHRIGHEIVGEIEQKRKRLQIPKHCSFRPVLIHVNGVSERVEESGYFSKIIDFGEFLEKD
jgi:hypothetical protein